MQPCNISWMTCNASIPLKETQIQAILLPLCLKVGMVFWWKVSFEVSFISPDVCWIVFTKEFDFYSIKSIIFSPRTKQVYWGNAGQTEHNVSKASASPGDLFRILRIQVNFYSYSLLWLKILLKFFACGWLGHYFLRNWSSWLVTYFAICSFQDSSIVRPCSLGF